MKWLILIFLISCGNQEPGMLDLDDHDGDQILNHLESDDFRYIANYEKLDVVRGIITHAAFKSQGVPFSNYSTLTQDSLRLMTGDKLTPTQIEFFSEWKNLVVDSSMENFQVTSNFNLIHIYFEETKTEPDEVIIKNGSFSRSLGKWSSYMKVQLNREEFQGILNGTIFLELKKSFYRDSFEETESDQTIRNKSQKVYVNNGKTTKVIYVSKAITSQKLYSILGIDSTVIVDNDLLFFNSLETGPTQWFEREVEGHRVFILTNIQDLKQSFHQKLRSNKNQLRRDNGVPGQSVQLKLDEKSKSKVYLKIRPNRVTRTFSEYVNSQGHQSGSPRHGSDEYWVCHYYMRQIASEVAAQVSINDLFNNTNLNNEQKENLKFEEQIDEQGVFWEISFIADSPTLTLFILPRPESSFTITGQYHVICDRNMGAQGSTASFRTNDENSLSFEIESHVEKIL